MNKLNKYFRVIFATASMLIVCFHSYAHNFEIGGIYYNIIDVIDETTKTVEVQGCNSSITGALSIPSSVTYNSTTYSVTSIDNDAFFGCSGLTSVTIPNSVTKIGDGAFYKCYGLTSVTIPNSVTSIGNSAFCKCSGLISVTIPNSVTTIGDWAFNECTGLTSVTIPNSVTTIGSYAFRECSGLTSVTIPNSVTKIGDGAFYKCYGLTSVAIGNSVTAIGNDAFYSCENLTEVNITDLYAWCKIGFGSSFANPLSDAKKLKLNGKEIKDLVIPNDITEIKSYAFDGCTGLTSVTIPNSVTSIDNNAFFGCSGLTSVTIGNSVTTIGEDAFCFCYYLTSVTIPNSVKEIGDRAFRDCDNLDSVIITNPNTRYNDNYNSDDYTFDKHTKIIHPKQEEKSERDSYRWQYVSYGDDKRGAKSTDGKEIVPTEYSEVEYVPNYDGYFLVRKNGCYAIYNPSGKIIIPISRGYSSIIKTRSDGRIYYRVSKGGKYGVCGIDGYEIVAPLYDNIICIDGVFLYKDINGTWIPLNKGLDKNNAVVENPTYTKRDVAYYDLALQQGRLEDSFGKKVRVEQTSTEGTRAFKIVFEDKILFEFGEYDLSSSALDYIDKVAETLKELPSTRVRITGYTDNVGSLASNRLLSTQRANAVSEYLQQKGISASRIIAKGVPLADYVATNKTEEGRALNRRVEIIIEAK